MLTDHLTGEERNHILNEAKTVVSCLTELNKAVFKTRRLPFGMKMALIEFTQAMAKPYEEIVGELAIPERSTIPSTFTLHFSKYDVENGGRIELRNQNGEWIQVARLAHIQSGMVFRITRSGLNYSIYRAVSDGMDLSNHDNNYTDQIEAMKLDGIEAAA